MLSNFWDHPSKMQKLISQSESLSLFGFGQIQSQQPKLANSVSPITASVWRTVHQSSRTHTHTQYIQIHWCNITLELVTKNIKCIHTNILWRHRHTRLLYAKGKQYEKATKHTQKTHCRLEAVETGAPLSTHWPLSVPWTSRLLALNHDLPFFSLFSVSLFPFSTLGPIPFVFLYLILKLLELLEKLSV